MLDLPIWFLFLYIFIISFLTIFVNIFVELFFVLGSLSASFLLTLGVIYFLMILFYNHKAVMSIVLLNNFRIIGVSILSKSILENLA